MDFIKDMLTNAYRGNPFLTSACIYLFFLAFAIVAHQQIKHLAAQPDAKTSAPKVMNQDSKDSDCSNIIADGGSTVSCNDQNSDKERKPTSGGSK